MTPKLDVLSENEVKESLKSVPQWSSHDHSIDREFTFKDFPQAIDFVNRLAKAAESEEHHPDISISYNKVKLDLSTHTAGGLTRKDFSLASKIDQLA